jgi:antirestriction protein ArdC
MTDTLTAAPMTRAALQAAIIDRIVADLTPGMRAALLCGRSENAKKNLSIHPDRRNVGKNRRLL